MKSFSKPKSQENAWLWSIKIVTGLLVLLLLFMHFQINHLSSPQGLMSYADVVKYYQLPSIPETEIAFLIFVVSHALIGLRGIILDLQPKAGLIKAVNWLFPLAGLGAIVYGSWLVITIAGRGTL